MPLARVDLPAGKPAHYGRAVADVVYEAMVATLKAPKDDRFQVISEHTRDTLLIDPTFLDIERSAKSTGRLPKPATKPDRRLNLGQNCCGLRRPAGWQASSCPQALEMLLGQSRCTLEEARPQAFPLQTDEGRCRDE